MRNGLSFVSEQTDELRRRLSFASAPSYVPYQAGTEEWGLLAFVQSQSVAQLHADNNDERCDELSA